MVQTWYVTKEENWAITFPFFLRCKNTAERKELGAKLESDRKNYFGNYADQNLIELTDAFDVRWILAV